MCDKMGLMTSWHPTNSCLWCLLAPKSGKIDLANLTNITYWHFFRDLLKGPTVASKSKPSGGRPTGYVPSRNLQFSRSICQLSAVFMFVFTKTSVVQCFYDSWVLSCLHLVLWLCTMNVRYHRSRKSELTWSSAGVSSLLGITFAGKGWSNCCYSQLVRTPAIDAYIWNYSPSGKKHIKQKINKYNIYIYT